MPFEMISGFAQ